MSLWGLSIIPVVKLGVSDFHWLALNWKVNPFPLLWTASWRAGFDPLTYSRESNNNSPSNKTNFSSIPVFIFPVSFTQFSEVSKIRQEASLQVNEDKDRVALRPCRGLIQFPAVFWVQTNPVPDRHQSLQTLSCELMRWYRQGCFMPWTIWSLI